MTRIVKLHFVRPEVTTLSRAAADNLNHLGARDVSHFLLMAAKKEAAVLELFRERVKVHEATLRGLPQLRVERISKNHAQMMALVDALRLIVPLTDHQVASVQQTLRGMALERQAAINADHPQVAEFWEVYEYLESLGDGPMVNHSKKDELIAINLNEFCERAAEHRQKLADVNTLRDLLRESRRHKLIEANKSVDSAVRAHWNLKNPLSPRCTTVKCWVFKK